MTVMRSRFIFQFVKGLLKARIHQFISQAPSINQLNKKCIFPASFLRVGNQFSGRGNIEVSLLGNL